MIRNFALALVVFYFGLSTASAATLDVPGNYPTIQSAINAAANGDEVVLAPGSYCEHDVDFIGKGIVVRGTDPYDDDVVAATIVLPTTGRGFIANSGEKWETTRLAGLTVRWGYSDLGGGVLVFRSGLSIDHVVFDTNVADFGAAIYGDVADLHVSSTTFESGSAGTKGGAVYLLNSFGYSFNNCVMRWNTAYMGGAIAMENAGGFFTNCRIERNGAGIRGGAVWMGGSYPTFMNCTVADNRATEGGGLYLRHYCNPTVRNSIMWGNDGDEVVTAGEVSDPVVEYSTVEGGWDGFGKNNIDADPLFRSFRGFDYLLSPGSPAMDAGDPAIADGMTGPRWYHNGPRSDMGAYGGPANAAWLD